MADTTITVTLDEATTEAYSLAGPTDQVKMQLLFRLLLREYATASSMTLSGIRTTAWLVTEDSFSEKEKGI